MKRFTVFAILTLFVLSSSTFNQFAKLPVFFHHYLEHAQLDQDWSISNFVSAHYNKIEHSDDKHGDHENLPFKAAFAFGFSITIPQSNLIFTLPAPAGTLKIQKVIETQSTPLQGVQNGVWRPPVAV
jgi:hypothetical protein